MKKVPFQSVKLLSLSPESSYILFFNEGEVSKEDCLELMRAISGDFKIKNLVAMRVPNSDNISVVIKEKNEVA